MQYIMHSMACIAEAADTRVVAFLLLAVHPGTNLLGNQPSHEAACGGCGKSALYSQEYTVLPGSCQGGVVLNCNKLVDWSQLTACNPERQIICITSATTC